MVDHVPGPVDFLKVDVEGFEREVLAGADWYSFRPRVVVMEATVPKSDEPAHEAWEPTLLEAGYRLALFDGLNRFYARADEPALLQTLAIPANVLDDFVPYVWTHQVDQAQQWAHSLEEALTHADQERDQLSESVAHAAATTRERAGSGYDRRREYGASACRGSPCSHRAARAEGDPHLQVHRAATKYLRHPAPSFLQFQPDPYPTLVHPVPAVCLLGR